MRYRTEQVCAQLLVLCKNGDTLSFFGIYNSVNYDCAFADNGNHDAFIKRINRLFSGKNAYRTIVFAVFAYRKKRVVTFGENIRSFSLFHIVFRYSQNDLFAVRHNGVGVFLLGSVNFLRLVVKYDHVSI